MHVIGHTAELKSFYVSMKDGTIQEVQAGCFKLTSDGMWTFYKESALPKIGGTVLHSIYSAGVKGIYNAEYVTLEAKMDYANKGNLNTELRTKASKKKTKTTPPTDNKTSQG
jgi:hypothetical protein